MDSTTLVQCTKDGESPFCQQIIEIIQNIQTIICTESGLRITMFSVMKHVVEAVQVAVSSISHE